MMVTLKFIKRAGPFYKIRYKQVGDNIIIYAPPPKSPGKRDKLKKALLPYSGQIIYPKGFSERDFPKGLDVDAAKKRKKLINFLKLCKSKRPKTAVIISNGQIAPAFYRDISPYVGKIVLPFAATDIALQNELLAFSGTPIIFGGAPSKSDDETVTLLL